MPTALSAEWKAAVAALRRIRFTQAQIAELLNLSKSRVQRTVAAVGLAKLSALEPPIPENRYERKRPGEMIHVDTKKLARFYQPRHRVTGDRSATKARHLLVDDRAEDVHIGTRDIDAAFLQLAEDGLPIRAMHDLEGQRMSVLC